MNANKVIMYGAQTIVYGAEAESHEALTLVERVRFAARRYYHGSRDAARFRAGDVSKLDYRNYEGRDAINLGDVAIAESTTALIKHALPIADISPINWGRLDQHEINDIDRKKTMLIFSGSGYFFLNPDGRLAERIKDDLAYLQEHTISAFFFGVGLNKPGQTTAIKPSGFHPEDAAMVAKLLERVQGISVRDATTQSILTPLTSKPVVLISDPALHFCHLMGIQKPFDKKHLAENAPPIIGVNFSFHGKNSTALLKKNLQAYCDVLLKLQHENGAEFRYFVHYGTENVLPKLLAQRGIKIKKIPTGTQRAGAGDTVALAREYAKLDLHIGGMLHSCILATSAGTPCLALAYDIKHQGFFDLMGLSENCFSAANFNPDALYLRAIDLLANPAQVRAHIAARRNQLEMETLNFITHQLKPS